MENKRINSNYLDYSNIISFLKNSNIEMPDGITFDHYKHLKDRINFVFKHLTEKEVKYLSISYGLNNYDEKPFSDIAMEYNESINNVYKKITSAQNKFEEIWNSYEFKISPKLLDLCRVLRLVGANNVIETNTENLISQNKKLIVALRSLTESEKFIFLHYEGLLKHERLSEQLIVKNTKIKKKSIPAVYEYIKKKIYTNLPSNTIDWDFCARNDSKNFYTNIENKNQKSYLSPSNFSAEIIKTEDQQQDKTIAKNFISNNNSKIEDIKEVVKMENDSIIKKMAITPTLKPLLNDLGLSSLASSTKINHEELNNIINDSISTLENRDYTILSKIYGLDGIEAVSQNKIALLLNLHPTRISQIKKAMLEKLSKNILDAAKELSDENLLNTQSLPINNNTNIKESSLKSVTETIVPSSEIKTEKSTTPSINNTITKKEDIVINNNKSIVKKNISLLEKMDLETKDNTPTDKIEVENNNNNQRVHNLNTNDKIKTDITTVNTENGRFALKNFVKDLNLNYIDTNNNSEVDKLSITLKNIFSNISENNRKSIILSYGLYNREKMDILKIASTLKIDAETAEVLIENSAYIIKGKLDRIYNQYQPLTRKNIIANRKTSSIISLDDIKNNLDNGDSIYGIEAEMPQKKVKMAIFNVNNEANNDNETSNLDLK